MRFNDLTNSFTDIGDKVFLKNPNIVVKASDINYKEIIAEADLYLAGETRKVIYEDDSGTKFYLECVPYLHPTGAADVTLGSLAYSSSNVATYTVTLEGQIIDEDGGLLSSGERAHLAAGMLFTDYYYQFNDNLSQLEYGRCVVLEEGDFTWVVRRGRVFLAYTGAAPAAGDHLMASTTVDGAVEVATAIDTTTAITLWATLKKNLTGDANDLGCVIAVARAAGSGGFVECDLLLPHRFDR